MDRIEPADGSNGSPDRQQELGSELNPLGPTSYPRNRNRTLSRSRRPSIRIQRPPSSYSIGSSTKDPEQDTRNHAGDRRSTATTQALLEGDEWQPGRRRSSSEPRPGRWSSPSPNMLSRTATRDYQIPMLTLKEEASSPVAAAPSQAYYDQLLTPPQQPAPAAPLAERRSLLRRTSEAALNTFSRNRASTVSGGEPSQANQSNRASEYDSHVVDVLDVIGMPPNVRFRWDML